MPSTDQNGTQGLPSRNPNSTIAVDLPLVDVWRIKTALRSEVGRLRQISDDTTASAFIETIERLDTMLPPMHKSQKMPYEPWLTHPPDVIDLRDSPDTKRLTKRELEVLQMWSEGLNNKQIATKLSVHFNTICTFGEHIRYKLGARSQLHCVLVAISLGLIREPISDNDIPKPLAYDVTAAPDRYIPPLSEAPKEPIGILSRREIQALWYYNQDYSNNEIAHAMNVRPDTAKEYISRCMRKMKLNSRMELLEKCRKLGWLPSTEM